MSFVALAMERRSALARPSRTSPVAASTTATERASVRGAADAATG